MKERILKGTVRRRWLLGAMRDALCMGRKAVMGMWTVVVGLSVHAQEPGFHLEGMTSRVLPVTGRKMTNVIFPVDIAAGVRVSRDVLVQKVRGVENVIELKALKRDFQPTSLAVYGKDGRLYSFVLHYVEDTTVLDYRIVPDGGAAEPKVRLAGWRVEPERLRKDARMLAKRRGSLHQKANGDGLRLVLKGVNLRDSLLWLSLELEDRTAMGCGPGDLRIYAEDRKRVNRTASQEVEISPVYAEGIAALPGLGRQATAVGLRPFVIGRGKRLVVTYSDEADDRQVVLKVKRKWLLRARNG
ncbi:MAG TPA: DUF4138 domain-containing protein [Puia sp.]|nr:DUF4138 domain-containing protein [Puia sp.]